MQNQIIQIEQSFPRKAYSPFFATTEGVNNAAEVLASGLIQHYQALRKDMFKWEDSSGLCKNMFLMSHYRCPEEHLVEKGVIAFFKLNNDVHALPLDYHYEGVNIYGFIDEWRVIGVNPEINRMLQRMRLNKENSVLCEDSLTFTYDYIFIRDIVAGMVDILLSMRQRSILNRQPVIFTDPQEPKQGEVGTFWKALLECRPYIITNPAIMDFKVFDAKGNVDIGITDYFNFLDSLILCHLGYDATDVHKRAQQSVPETLICQDKIVARRQEKLRLRQEAADRCNELFGCNLKVTSVLDENDTSLKDMEGEINKFVNGGNNERD